MSERDPVAELLAKCRREFQSHEREVWNWTSKLSEWPADRPPSGIVEYIQRNKTAAAEWKSWGDALAALIERKT